MKKLLVPAILAAAVVATAQPAAQSSQQQSRPMIVSSMFDDMVEDDEPAMSLSDSLLTAYDDQFDDPFSQPMSLPDVFFMPAIYDRYEFFKPLAIGDTVYSGVKAMRWLEDYEVLSRQMKSMQRELFYNHPELVRYNVAMLPEAPKQYETTINPADFTITTIERQQQPTDLTISVGPVGRRHWLRTFNASLQFSQAYVSPNWYQGGNDNLNALANVYYNVKLNPEYHPNLLFETTMQYKLGMNNAPEDSIHAYSISEDVFQVNTTFGIKAAHRWYYSFTGQFKTQLLNSYKSNSRELTSSFLSPGELTAGIGMTYNYVNKPKTLNFDASIAPLSYHLLTCTNHRIDAGKYNIDEGRTTKHSFGSTAELKLEWKMSYNITLRSRLFAFTDYDSFQADWENTLMCNINRFFTTQIYAHLRYDTRTPNDPDNDWHKLQLKEIFSIGFAYKFSSI